MKNIRTSLAVLALVAVCVFPVVAMADLTDEVLDTDPITLQDIVRIVRSIINYGIVLATLAVVAMIVYAGFKMATSRGVEKDYEDGKKMLKYAIYGALVVFGVGLIVNTIANVAYNPAGAL